MAAARRGCRPARGVRWAPGLVCCAPGVEGPVRRGALADGARPGLRQADCGGGVRQREHPAGPEPVLRGGDRPRRAVARDRRARDALAVRQREDRGGQRARAGTGEEPVHARLHHRPRERRAEGAPPRARRGHPQRRQARGRRDRRLPESHHRRHSARREDVLHREEPHGALHHAEERQWWRRAMSCRRWVLGFGIWVLGFALCAQSARAQARACPSEQPPRPLPAHEVTFPPYEIRSLANGMRVVAVLHHEQPAVSIRLLVGAGSAQDPKGKGGVANLTASLLDQGTTTRTAQQIADQIDFIGGDLGTGAATDLSFVNAIVMKDSFQTGMDLLADIARNPSFATEEIARQKDQILSSLRVNADDPGYIADVVFDRLVFGFHPYGLPGSGTEESLGSLAREDLQAFHRQYFVPNNMILAIVGDVTSAQAFDAAHRVVVTTGL